jgi:hypothetical protein
VKIRLRTTRILAAILLTAAALACLVGCGRYTYEGVDLSQYVPERYLDDVMESLDRAGDNAPAVLEALLGAPVEDREAVSFLVAEMPSADLATVEASFVLDTARLAREARERFPWGGGIPDEVYLHYVLPPRVSQEPLEPWRDYMFGELSKRLEGIESMKEAAVEVNRWCGERVGFKPTQRRDQGVFETLASGYGRCEEMMIVHIAALRSVAIPARQAWTPYWATSDNNHAWTELWVDSDWHYTGACEPRDELDDAWFNESVKGAALVMSSVTGSPAETDEVYREEERYSLVNSTRHYVEPGLLEVSVVQHGMPAVDVSVNVSLWNFGALRAIARDETDSAGRVRLSIGDGDYFVSAGEPSAFDWKIATIVSGETTTIELALDESPSMTAEFWLMYAEEES